VAALADGRRRARNAAFLAFPRQAYLDADLARMFPPAIVTRIQRREVAPLPSWPELKAEAVRNAQ
jgi:hypothetical protein